MHEEGAILSPLQRAVEEEINSYQQDSVGYTKTFGNPEKYAEQQLREADDYNFENREYEWEVRIKCISIIVGEMREARNHACINDQFNERKGGVVLGIKFPEEELKRIAPSYKNGAHVIIPKLLPLDTLKEVHLPPRAYEQSFDLVKAAFDRYHPEYKQLRRL